jgi:hypothetical protein
MLSNITIDTANIVTNQNIHENIFKSRQNINKENTLPSPSPKHDEYLSRSQLNRGLSRFAALGTAVEERERVLELQEALKSKTNEFEQRNLLLIRSKDALEELGKRCSEAQERADASASEVIALATAAEVAQAELIELRNNYEEDLETMQIKYTSLEHEVVRLKEVEKKFHHFKFVEKVASKARNEKQHKLFQVIGQQNDKIETQSNVVTTLKTKYDAIIKQQNEHIQTLKLDHAKVISALKKEMENLKAAQQQQRESHASRTKKGNKPTNATKTSIIGTSKSRQRSSANLKHPKRYSNSSPEAVVLAQVLNHNNSPKPSTQHLHQNNLHDVNINNSKLKSISNQMMTMKMQLDNEKNETSNLRMKIQEEKQMREQICERLKLMEYQMYNNKNNNQPKVMVASKSNISHHKAGITDINTTSYGLDNMLSSNETTMVIKSISRCKKSKLKKKSIKKKVTKKKNGNKKKLKKNSTEMIKLHIPKATARVLLAYRENLC